MSDSDIERAYASKSGNVSGDEVALGDEPHRIPDAEFAALPEWARKALQHQRDVRDARYAKGAAATAKLMASRMADIAALNRVAALQTDGTHFWTQCACRWHGLKVGDAEVARREYDAHACRIDGDHALDRAVAEVDRNTLAKREPEQMVIAPSLERDEVVEATPTVVDDAEQRFALVELK